MKYSVPALLKILLFAFINISYAEDYEFKVKKALDQFEQQIQNPNSQNSNQKLVTVIPDQEQIKGNQIDPLSYQDPLSASDEVDLMDIDPDYGQQKEKGALPRKTGTPFSGDNENEEISIEVSDQGPTGREGEEVLSENILNKESKELKSSQPQEDIPDGVMIDVLELKGIDIIDVLKLISQKSSLNIIAGKEVVGKVTIYLKDVKLKDALTIILDSNNLAYKMEDGIVRVMPQREFEARYGYKFGGKIETRIVQLKFADVVDMVTVLNQMKSPLGKIIFDLKSGTLVLMDSLEKIQTMEDLIKEIDVPVETQIFELSYAQVKEVSAKIMEVLTKNVGQIKFDERTNKMVVTDTHLRLKDVERILKAFDIKQQQVLIEAKIIQVVLSDQFKFGIDWEAIIKDYHKLDLVADFDVLASTDKKGKVSVGTLSKDDYTVFLEALEAVGKTNILSSPSITTLNNQEAKILVGSTEPYVTTTTTTPASGPTTTAESVQFIDVGVKLYVTPTIHKDNFITMKIKPEVSSITKTLKTSTNNTIPVKETSEAETMVMVKDGVTIVIGGLIKDEKIASQNQIPLLGSIPFLGHIFRNRDDLTRKTEIVIFLTPRIVSGDIPTKKLPLTLNTATQNPIHFDVKEED